MKAAPRSTDFGCSRHVSDAAAVSLLSNHAPLEGLWGHRRFRDASLEVDASEVHALVGGVGAGQSTLIKILAGAVKADASGRGQRAARLDCKHSGRAPSSLDFPRCISKKINVLPRLSVAENLFLPPYPTRFAGLIDWPCAP